MQAWPPGLSGASSPIVNNHNGLGREVGDTVNLLFGAAGLAEAIVQTVDQPLLILSPDLTVMEANAAFCNLFGVGAEETRGRALYELGNRQWDIPELRRLLEEVLPQRSAVKGYRIEHKFPSIGKRVMILNAKRLPADGDRPELILLTVSDRTEAEQARFEIEGHQEFQEKLIDSVRESLLVLGWDLRVVRANQSFYETFRVSPSASEGRLVYELGNGQWDIPRLRKLLEDVLPKDQAFDDVEVEHEFESIGRRIMLLNGRRLDHLDLILLAIRDVTEQRQLEAQQQTLMGELDHRVRNVLSSVNALVSGTLRSSHSLGEFSQAFQARFTSMTRAQGLLMQAPEADTELAEVVRQELWAQGGQDGIDFNLDGPEVWLPPKSSQIFAMAIHELTTNAAKHGALASPNGRVEISWKAEAAEGGETHVRFGWREHCAGIETSPARKGYGSQVLEAVFRHLNGTSNLTLHPDGAELIAEFKLEPAEATFSSTDRGAGNVN